MVDATLNIRGLKAGYGKLEILHDITLSIGAGEFIALMGPNGAGKSTLLKALFGMATHKGGTIEWKGQQLAQLSSKAVLKTGIAYVPQGRCNFQLMTVLENLEMASYAMERKSTAEELDYIYDIFPILKQRSKQIAGNLSGGEQQLLEMAMAMLRHPEILLIDEPSAGLSPQAISLVFDELKRLHEGGRTILLVEQNTRKAMEVAERSVVMRLGQVIWDGMTDQITMDDLGSLFMSGHIRQSA